MPAVSAPEVVGDRLFHAKAHGCNFHPVWDWRGEGKDYRFRENLGVPFHWESFHVGDVLGRERGQDFHFLVRDGDTEDDSFGGISCCSLDTGRAERSPPCITSESLTSPASSLRARWNASRSPKDMDLKLGP